MAKSSIHLQTAKGGTILHNARENYSKSVVFTDEKNELWNDSKTAFKLFREELEIRTKAYTERTGQKLHKNTSTLISGVVNLEQHHTLEDLIPIKKYLEDKFDTKVIQMSVHRDEGKLISIDDEDEKLVSGIDFFLNPTNKKLYYEKEFINEIDMSKWKMEKNYHGHFEMLGLDTQGKTLRHKMNIYALKQLQDFTAESLKMERTPSNVIVNEKGEVKRKSRFIKKRLDTHDFKKSKKEENEVKKIIKNHKEEKAQLKSDLEFVKNEFKSIREMLKGTGATREDFKKIDDLNKQLQNDLKNNEIDIKKATDEIKNLVIDLKIDNKIKDEKVKELTNLAYSNVLYTNTNNRVPYKVLNEDKKKKLKEKDELIEKLNEKIKGYDSQIAHIENLEKQINDLLLDIQTKVSQIENLKNENESLKNENEVLKKENESLQEQINTLTIENLDLKDKINSSPNMSDYEALKNENESLKNEYIFLKGVVEKVLSYANYKIRELINFGKPQVKKSVSIEDFIEKDKKEDNHKSNLNGLETLNKNLDNFVSSNQKKEDLDYSEYHNNLLQR